MTSIAFRPYDLARSRHRCHHRRGVTQICSIPDGAVLMGAGSFAQWCRWQLRALGPNPLVRGSDRLETLSLLVAIVMAISTIPLASRVETDTYDGSLHTVAEQTQNRHSVEAVVIEGSQRLPTDFDSPIYVLAQWRDGQQLRTERVVSAATVDEGSSLTVWLDRAGKVVSAPLTQGDAKVSAVSVAATVWLLIVVVSGLMALAARWGLDRVRARAWERELRLMAHNDDGWANRRT